MVLPSLGNMNFFNVYMPSGSAVSKRNERVGVIKKLNKELIVSLEMRVILGGDVNLTEGPKDILNFRQKSLI